jgi:hypothetical protein
MNLQRQARRKKWLNDYRLLLQMCNNTLHAQMLSTFLSSLLAAIMRNGTSATNLVEFPVCISVKLKQCTEHCEEAESGAVELSMHFTKWLWKFSFSTVCNIHRLNSEIYIYVYMYFKNFYINEGT